MDWGCPIVGGGERVGCTVGGRVYGGTKVVGMMGFRLEGGDAYFVVVCGTEGRDRDAIEDTVSYVCTP